MIKNKEITSRDENFADWYTNIVQKADIVDYSSIKGFNILAPLGCAIWENIQNFLNKRFKETGHQNVMMPVLIPQSLLQKEADHIEGFAPETALVCEAGGEKLAEKLCVRPTSETLFCDYYSKIVKSHRDLPKKYNQWCSVVRWEKETRPLLRGREFWWQEGHTVHASKEEAEEETMQMLKIYQELFEKVLAIPVIVGKKTKKETFAGAEYTLTVETLMYNGVTLQSATSHYFGENFSRPFNITFANKENKLEYAKQTSWGITTRTLGAIVMVHGDDNGLVLPPKVAPNQVVIIPIKNTENVLKASKQVENALTQANISNFTDLTERSAGFKFAEHEMKGVPVRIEIGEKDLSSGVVTVVRRDTLQKSTLPLDEHLAENISKLLDDIQTNMYETAKKRMEEKTFTAYSLEEMEKIISTTPGFIKTMWCGDQECEEKAKKKFAIKSRCMPFKQEKIADKCAICGKEAKYLVIWGIQY